MSLRADLREAPWKFNFFGLLRAYERTHTDSPRIGTSVALKEEYIDVGQDPFLDFPTSNITKLIETPQKPDRLRVRFLGFFGPQGALPLNTTAEVIEWQNRRSNAFVRFVDIFAGRFYQVFFRGWSASRRIAQFDRPDNDRFQFHIRAIAGVPEPVETQQIDSVARYARLHVAGLLGSRIRGPQRLKQILHAALGVDAEIEEFIPTWLDFELGDRSSLGTTGSTLGVDLRLGSRVQTIDDKVRISIRTESLEEYRAFLPGQRRYNMLVDLAHGFLGPIVDIDIAPSLPAGLLPGVRIGKEGTIGHTSWIAPPKPREDGPKRYIRSAVFAAAATRDEEEETAA